MIILGISCFYHDAAAAILKDGEIIAAAQEERFTRKNMTQLSLQAPLPIGVKQRLVHCSRWMRFFL